MSTGPDHKTAELMTRFLLGELSEEERPAVEERFLSDSEFFDQLLVVEDALIGDFLQGRLSADRRQRAESLLRSSSTQRREVEFTRDLISFLGEARTENTTAHVRVAGATLDHDLSAKAAPVELVTGEKESPGHAPLALIVAGFRRLPPFYSATVGLSLLLMLGALTYLALRSYSDRRAWMAQRAAWERNAADAENKLAQQSRDASELGKQLEQERDKRILAEESLAQLQARESSSLMSILLLPTTFERGGNSKTVTLTPGTARVQIQLQINQTQPPEQYSVAITTFDGRSVWSKNAIHASQIKHGKLNLLLPSSLLKYDDYRAELKGLSEDGSSMHLADYTFKVRK